MGINERKSVQAMSDVDWPEIGGYTLDGTEPRTEPKPAGVYVSTADSPAPDYQYTVDELGKYTKKAPDTMARMRELVPRLVDLDDQELYLWSDLFKTYGLAKGEFKNLLTQQRNRSEARRKKIQVELAEDQGTLLPSPYEPTAVARALVKKWPSTGDTSHLAWWRDDYYEWNGKHWEIISKHKVIRMIFDATEPARSPSRIKVQDVLYSLSEAVLQRDASTEDSRFIAPANGALDLETRSIYPHHPQRFNLTSLPFNFDEYADCPRWLDFLTEVLPDDPQAIALLQEWFGYVLSGRTDLQKSLSVVGPPRCGKGTIIRVLEHLLGTEAVVTLKLHHLGDTFGLEPAIGKSLAVFPDIKWNVQNVPEALEAIQEISGEDTQTVNRKNRTAWRGRLGIRVMLVSNFSPSFEDASGAMASRLMHLEMRTSFEGREDTDLENKLIAELPGIFNWALAGIDRLNLSGRFSVPDSSREAERQLRMDTSVTKRFLEDRAIVAGEDELLAEDVYQAFREFCEAEGIYKIKYLNRFVQDVANATNRAVCTKRIMKNGIRRLYFIGLKPAYQGALKPAPRYSAPGEARPHSSGPSPDNGWIIGVDD
jgi:putative DNA primase/helicase